MKQERWFFKSHFYKVDKGNFSPFDPVFDEKGNLVECLETENLKFKTGSQRIVFSPIPSSISDENKNNYIEDLKRDHGQYAKWFINDYERSYHWLFQSHFDKLEKEMMRNKTFINNIDSKLENTLSYQEILNNVSNKKKNVRKI